MIGRAEFVRRRDHYFNRQPSPPQQQQQHHLQPLYHSQHHPFFQDDHHQSEQQVLLKQGLIWSHGREGPIDQQGQQDGAVALASTSLSSAVTGIAGTSTSRGRSKLATMKEPPSRTKVVIRHLPPSLPESAFLEQIESRFAGLYHFFAFCPGKSSLKGSKYARAYIDFRNPEDVFKFHDAFDGHTFVNEKGSQYKALVEYAPFQRVPKPSCKKDVRDGSIFKDPEYLEFLEVLAKPVENLPSAEVQLERKEAERNMNLGAKEAIIVTPLMEYVRQKRALKPASQRLLAASAGKLSTRGLVSSPGTSNNLLSRRGGERSRTTAMYLPTQVAIRTKEKTTYVPRREETQRRDREIMLDKKRRESLDFKDKKLVREKGLAKVVSSDQDHDSSQEFQDESPKTSSEASPGGDPTSTVSDSRDTDQADSFGVTEKVSLTLDAATDLAKETRDGRNAAKKKVLLVKDREREPYNGAVSVSPVFVNENGNGALRQRTTNQNRVSAGSLSSQSGIISSSRGTSMVSRPISRRDGGRSGRIFSSRDSGSLQQQVAQPLSQSEQAEKEKRPPRPPIVKASGSELNVIPVCESETSALQNNVAATRSMEEKSEVVYGDGTERRLRNRDRPDRPVWTVRQRSENPAGSNTMQSSSTGGTSSSSQGNQKHVRRDRSSSHSSKETDSNLVSDVSKAKRGSGPAAYGGHEKQVWVAKLGSGT